MSHAGVLSHINHLTQFIVWDMAIIIELSKKR